MSHMTQTRTPDTASTHTDLWSEVSVLHKFCTVNVWQSPANIQLNHQTLKIAKYNYLPNKHQDPPEQWDLLG
jgi:hypothetical protein